jgi:hypothetical protein
MCRYLVLDANATGLRIGLSDSYGKYHFARALAAAPAIGAELHGARPDIGFHLLEPTPSGQAFRTDFKLVNCSRGAMLDLLHAPSGDGDAQVPPPVMFDAAHTSANATAKVADLYRPRTFMHRYRVYEKSPTGAEIALHDSGGRYHVARAISNAPAVGADLHGSRPGLGFRVLQCAATGKIFRVAFQLIDGDRQQTLERLHPQLTR